MLQIIVVVNALYSDDQTCFLAKVYICDVLV